MMGKRPGGCSPCASANHAGGIGASKSAVRAHSCTIWCNRELCSRQEFVHGENGVKKEELIEVITHLAFYSGWPNAMTAILLGKELFEKADSK